MGDQYYTTSQAMAKLALSKAMFQGKSIAPGRLAYNFPLDEQGIKRLQELSGRGV